MTEILRKVPTCRRCDLVSDCTPVVEAVLAVITISTGMGLAFHPGLMAGSRALVELLDYMPQTAWAATFCTLGVSKMIAVGAGSQTFRALTLAAGLLLWLHLSYVTGAETMQPVLAPYLYTPLALINAVALICLGWQMGQPHRER